MRERLTLTHFLMNLTLIQTWTLQGEIIILCSVKVVIPIYAPQKLILDYWEGGGGVRERGGGMGG